jgi:Luciferase
MNLADRLANALLEIEGVEERRSRFGHEIAFYRDDREFLHLHGEREADVRLGRDRIGERRAELEARTGVRLRDSRSSDWVIVALARDEDVDFVLGLAAEATSD